jgi:hypothetical protein
VQHLVSVVAHLGGLEGYVTHLFVLVKMEEYVHHQDSVLVDMVGLETDVKILYVHHLV